MALENDCHFRGDTHHVSVCSDMKMRYIRSEKNGIFKYWMCAFSYGCFPREASVRHDKEYGCNSKFERSGIIGMKEAGSSNRIIARHISVAIRRYWQKRLDNDRFQHHYGSGRSRATADKEVRLIVRPAVVAHDSL
ncbi:hypothetical protein TNCV_2395321 [Trichonephila clavipes]|nr:hypothetical protein TNCV_2395321 [Trichonephila clavipes]